MENCKFCADVFSVGTCILETTKIDLKDNLIQYSGSNLNITHNSLYVSNTGTVISIHLLNHVNHHEIMEYYEIFIRQGHVSI